MRVALAAVLLTAACASTPSPVAAPASATPTTCASGAPSLAWTAGQPPPAPACLRTGARLSIRLYPADLHEWTMPVSSDPAVLRVVTAAANQEGAMAVTVQAQAPGQAVLSSVAQARDGAPDPHDQPWRITVTVVG